MTRIQCNDREGCFQTDVKFLEKRKRKRGGNFDNARGSMTVRCTNINCFGASSIVAVLSVILVLVSQSETNSASAWLTGSQSTSVNTAWERKNRSTDFPCPDDCRLSPFSRKGEQQLYATPESQKKSDRDDYEKQARSEKPDGKLKTSKVQFDDDFRDFDSNDDLDSLRAQAAKLRREAESLQSAIQESKEAKIQREIDKVDGWIDDLLIEVTLGDGTELLKTVDQVYDVLMKERYSAHHVLKIFERLCDLREQESRSNISPLMELLVDATGKLDCTEREDNPNKRWNHRVERVLRRKLFARDWNIEYVSEDERSW